MFRLASTRVTTPVNESAQVLFAERSRCARISATVVNAGLPALHGQTMADRRRIIVRRRNISVIVVPINPFFQGQLQSSVGDEISDASEARTKAPRGRNRVVHGAPGRDGGKVIVAVGLGIDGRPFHVILRSEAGEK